MNVKVLALALLIAAVVSTPDLAAAHGDGSVTRLGFVELQPAGVSGAFNESRLAAIGLPLEVGTTLRVNWSSDGGAGPPVEFAIHHHTPSTVVYGHRASGVVGSTSWAIPAQEAYWLSWENLGPDVALVSYSVHADPPMPNLLWFALPIVVVAASFLVLWLAQRHPAPPRADR